jgi:CheY-like chemotaxis protein
MKQTAEGLLLCPYCNGTLNWVPQRWFGRGSFVCERCGEFPDLAGDADAASLAVATAEQSGAAILPGRDERPRVLLVEDAAAHRDLYALMLERTMTVLTASRGDEALAIAAREPLDAIVLDVMMPGMDGWTVCERLQASPLTREIPVIMLTSLDGPETNARAERAGAVAVLTKPCPIERLTMAIDRAIRNLATGLWAPAPIVVTPPARPPAITRKRRWTRKPVNAVLPAQVDRLPVHLLNISYGGVCVEIEQPTAELPASFDVMFPTSDVLIHADAVWMNRGRDQHWLCGAEISTVTDEWRGLVDALM